MAAELVKERAKGLANNANNRVLSGHGIAKSLVVDAQAQRASPQSNLIPAWLLPYLKVVIIRE